MTPEVLTLPFTEIWAVSPQPASLAAIAAMALLVTAVYKQARGAMLA